MAASISSCAEDRLYALGRGAHLRLQAGPVLRRHAHQLTDHRHGQGQGEVGHELDVAFLSHGVEQVGHQLVHGRAEPLDLARRERTRHQAAQPGVVRRVGHQHVVLRGLEEFAAPRPVLTENAGGRTLDGQATPESGVAQHGLALVVAVHDVGAERRPADPGLFAHEGVVRVGIRLALGSDQHLQQPPVEVGALRDRHGVRLSFPADGADAGTRSYTNVPAELLKVKPEPFRATGTSRTTPPGRRAQATKATNGGRGDSVVPVVVSP